MSRVVGLGVLAIQFGCRTHLVKDTDSVVENEETGLRSWDPDTGWADSAAWSDSAASADTGGGSDIGDEPDPETLEPTWCIDWESGTLEDAGYSGSQVELKDGAIVLVAEEGQEYSALIGEDQLDYGGTHTLGTSLFPPRRYGQCGHTADRAVRSRTSPTLVESTVRSSGRRYCA